MIVKPLSFSASLLLLLLLTAPFAHAAASCKVVGIADGDTLLVRCEKKRMERVRLAEIDAPEIGQAFGRRAKESLSAMCYGKQATLKRQKNPDDYGRTLARVTCNGKDVNAEQVRRGMAWVYDHYVTDRSLYALQKDAQRAKRGLWAGKKPTPPWEYRRKEHQASAGKDVRIKK
ncbi:MAG: thermonuclease family protein [Burkholderiales bacterium]|jgi:endonuclease YncB( thermonuclease family)|nr:thermonuclease family protein [Burkholderiales bacterium]